MDNNLADLSQKISALIDLFGKYLATDQEKDTKINQLLESNNIKLDEMKNKINNFDGLLNIINTKLDTKIPEHDKSLKEVIIKIDKITNQNIELEKKLVIPDITKINIPSHQSFDKLIDLININNQQIINLEREIKELQTQLNIPKLDTQISLSPSELKKEDLNNYIAKGIQKYIENEDNLVKEIIKLTKDKYPTIKNRIDLTRLPPPILYHYLAKASENIKN